MKKFLLTFVMLISVFCAKAQDYTYITPTYSIVGKFNAGSLQTGGFQIGHMIQDDAVDRLHWGFGSHFEIGGRCPNGGGSIQGRISPYFNLQCDVNNSDTDIIFFDVKAGYSFGIKNKLTNEYLHGVYATAGIGARFLEKKLYTLLSYRLNDYREIQYQEHGIVASVGWAF